MSGRHRKPSQANYSVAKIAVTGAVLGGGGFALSGHAAAATDDEWDRVANCESSGNWAINTGNGYQGGLQFAPSTWSSHGGSEFAPAANMASKDEQILVAERVLASQGRGAWPVCGTGLSAPTQRTLAASIKEAPADLPPVDAPPVDAPIDAPVDAAPVDAAPLDAPVDAPLDVPVDAAPVDAPVDAAPLDAPVDAQPAMEAFTAVPADAPVDAAPVDAPVDAVPNAPLQDFASAGPEIVPDLQAVPQPVFDVANQLMTGETPTGLTIPEGLPVGNEIPRDWSGHADLGYVQELWQAMQDQGITSPDALEALAHPELQPAPEAQPELQPI